MFRGECEYVGGVYWKFTFSLTSHLPVSEFWSVVFDVFSPITARFWSHFSVSQNQRPTTQQQDGDKTTQLFTGCTWTGKCRPVQQFCHDVLMKSEAECQCGIKVFPCLHQKKNLCCSVHGLNPQSETSAFCVYSWWFWGCLWSFSIFLWVTRGFGICPWQTVGLFCLVHVSLGSLVAVHAKVKMPQKQQQQTTTK